MDKIAYYEAVYSILVRFAGARESSMRQDFVFHHARSTVPCTEFRFIGSLGHGGKYRSRTNTVDCYTEDENPERLRMIEETNQALANLKEQCEKP